MATDTALIVIDVQRVMYESPDMQPFKGREVLATIKALIERARAAGVPVVYIRHDGGADSPFPIGSDLWQIMPDIAPESGEHIVEKTKPDAFAGTTLKATLDTLDAKRLILCGLQTDCCVDTTCRRASSEGYDTILAADAHTTFDFEVLDAPTAIRYHNWTLAKRFATVLPAVEIEL